ncbi:MAG: endonuclease domain-containing protein [Candidatus Magasanikbacteria bacterium]
MEKIFNQSKHKDLRKILREDCTKSEAVLWKYLKGKQMGYRFRRQHGIGRYIVDFYCPKLKLIIEVDGYTHIDHDQYIYDMERENYLRSLGLVVKRYTGEQIFKHIREVYLDLQNICEELSKG